MRRSLVLDTSVRVLYPSILVLSLYFLFAGHNQPGGGFVGGLAAGAAISLRYVAGGAVAVRTSFRMPAHWFLGIGLLASVGTAIIPMLLGHSILEHATFEEEFPLIGTVKVTSALPFDVGVYLVVIGVVLMAFDAFGDDPDDQIEHIEEPAPAPGRQRADFASTPEEAAQSFLFRRTRTRDAVGASTDGEDERAPSPPSDEPWHGVPR